MLRKLLIINLLFTLALLPAAQAVSPAAAPADAAHDLMVMDCGEVDPNHCIDYDSCVSGSHASCDVKSKSTQLLPESVERPRGQVYAAHPTERYSSNYADILLRPPRIA